MNFAWKNMEQSSECLSIQKPKKLRHVNKLQKFVQNRTKHISAYLKFKYTVVIKE